MIDEMCTRLAATMWSNAVLTAVHPLSAERVDRKDTVKVVRSYSGRALYFSRTAIPHALSRSAGTTYWGHIGVYGYPRSVLERWHALRVSGLEAAEQLEQLRLMENDIPIETYAPTQSFSRWISVDRFEDLQEARRVLGE